MEISCVLTFVKGGAGERRRAAAEGNAGENPGGPRILLSLYLARAPISVPLGGCSCGKEGPRRGAPTPAGVSNLRRTRNLLRRKQYRLREPSQGLVVVLASKPAEREGGGRGRDEGHEGEAAGRTEKELSCFHCARTKRIPGHPREKTFRRPRRENPRIKRLSPAPRGYSARSADESVSG